MYTPYPLQAPEPKLAHKNTKELARSLPKEFARLCPEEIKERGGEEKHKGGALL